MSSIPSSWEEVEIGNIADVIGGGTPKAGDATNFAEPGTAIAWLTPADLSGYELKEISFGKRDLSSKGLETSSARLLPKGVVLFSSRAPIGYVAIAQNEISTNQGFKSFVFTDDIDSNYAYYYLKSIRSLAESRGTGTTFKELSGAAAKKLPFVVAPLNEQIRIANKLDSLLAKVDAAQTRLEKVPSLLKRFRQAVLAAATSGELTREWRGNADHSWPNIILKDVAAGFNYGSSAKSKSEGNVPVLRMGNLQGGKLDWTKLVFTSDPSEIEKYLLEPGDVLFNRTNSPELVGKTSIYRGERKAIYAGYLIRVKGTDELDSEYLNLQMNSPHARDYCWQVKTDGVSQSNINAKKLQAYQFELPSIDEQKEIVRRVESLFTLADTVEKQYLAAKQRLDRLSQSILAKAFRGELVPQDSNDEPASELLKRIQAERVQQSQNKPKRKTVAKKKSVTPKNAEVNSA